MRGAGDERASNSASGRAPLHLPVLRQRAWPRGIGARQRSVHAHSTASWGRGRALRRAGAVQPQRSWPRSTTEASQPPATRRSCGARTHLRVLGSQLKCLELLESALLLHLVADLDLVHLVLDQLHIRAVATCRLESLDTLAGVAQDALDLVLVRRGRVIQIAWLLALGVEMVNYFGLRRGACTRMPHRVPCTPRVRARRARVTATGRDTRACLTDKRTEAVAACGACDVPTAALCARSRAVHDSHPRLCARRRVRARARARSVSLGRGMGGDQRGRMRTRHCGAPRKS